MTETRTYYFSTVPPLLLPGCGPESRGADYVYGVEGAARAAPSTPYTQSAPRFLGPQPGSKTGCRKPKAVKHGLALLKMGIKLPETC
jgi:hypothetical protein